MASDMVTAVEKAGAQSLLNYIKEDLYKVINFIDGRPVSILAIGSGRPYAHYTCTNLSIKGVDYRYIEVPNNGDSIGINEDWIRDRLLLIFEESPINSKALSMAERVRQVENIITDYRHVYINPFKMLPLNKIE
jgi:hypothetical protein